MIRKRIISKGDSEILVTNSNFDPQIFNDYNTLIKKDASVITDVNSLLSLDARDASGTQIFSNAYSDNITSRLGKQWANKVWCVFPNYQYDRRLKFLHSIIGIQIFDYIMNSPLEFDAFKIPTFDSGYYIYKPVAD